MNTNPITDAALAEWARVYARMYDATDFHASLTYIEAEALADLLHVAGEPNLAITLIEEWAENDPEEVEFHDNEISEAIARYKAHPSYSEES